MSQSKQTNGLIEFKEFDQDYRDHEIDTGDLQFPDINPSLLCKEFWQCKERYNNWKEQEISTMDGLLKEKKKQLVELVISVVDQRILAGKEVTPGEFSIWSEHAKTDWVKEARIESKKEAERKADLAIAEQKAQLEQDTKALERQVLDLQVELEAAKDWSALKRKSYET